MINKQYFHDFKSFKTSYNYGGNSVFNLISVNMRSMSSIDKFNKFKSLLANFPILPCVISVQETWFKEGLTQIYNIAGYRAVHCCRVDGYGGTSVFVREDIDYTTVLCESRNFIDSIIITLDNVKLSGKPIRLLSFYRSQKCDVNSFLSFLEGILSSQGRCPCVFVGDSNIDALDTRVSDELLNILVDYDFENCHTLITRPRSGKSIDHVYSNIREIVGIESVECRLSDHNLIHLNIGIAIQDLNCVHKTYSCVNQYQLTQRIRRQLPSIGMTENPSNDMYSLMSLLKNCMDDSTITSTRKCTDRHDITPWVNGNLRKLIDFKERLLRARRKKPSDNGIERQLKSISKVIRIACRESRNNFYINNLENIRHEPGKCWRFLNRTLGRNCKDNSMKVKDSDGNLISDDSEKARVFNKYFLESVKDLKSSIDQRPNDHCNSMCTLIRRNTTLYFDFTTVAEVQDIISNLSARKSSGYDNISPRTVVECADVLSPYLANIFNNIVTSGIYPDVLKVHKVVPIPKELNASKVEKYRPIAVLPIFDNIFERILHNQISAYMDGNNLLSSFQFGFKKGCGTEEAAINVVNGICKGFDDGMKGVAGVFYDFSKAFDLVDHKILLNKLEYYGIRGEALQILNSYLYNRKQYVEINGCRSSQGLVEHGVPQGSVLGPLLFKMYLNDITNLGLTGRIFIYADDICLIYPYKHETVARTYMERDAALISEFARINKLFLNADKTKVIRFKPYLDRSSTFGMYIDGKEICEVNSLKYLGLQLQSNLSWDQHIQLLRTKISRAVGLLYKFKYKFNHETKFLLYQALVQSNLNYLTLLYGYRKSVEFRSLFRLQNKALKTVANLPMTYSTISLYKNVFPSVLPLYGMYKMQLLVYVFKCVHNIGHHTIIFSINQNVFNTRNNTNLRVARCRLELTKQRIEYMGSYEFNNLPHDLKTINRISTFKNQLKIYLLQHVDDFLN